ncbi:MAG: hypothetical protein HY074_08110 [Deltaproteobacteria bacterium]|nr:hypothetical protein [Deltaproteobacteria bacterium]
MKTKTTVILAMVGMMMGTMVFADELKKKEIDKPTNLSAQVIDNSKEAQKSDTKKDDTAARPYHFVGHSE